MIRSSDKGHQQWRTLTILQVFIFYSICILSAWFVSWLLMLTGLTMLYEPIVCSGFYALLLIPVAYTYDPRIFAKGYWNISRRAWVGIGMIAVMQLLFESGNRLPPVADCREFAALLIAPFVEEFARAVMICPLMARLGSPAGLALTALLWAWPHDFFWLALTQQSILCLIFVCTRKSLPAVIAAHLIMNVIAIWHIGLRAHPLINVLGSIERYLRLLLSIICRAP
jgi:hypothetical protein